MADTEDDKLREEHWRGAIPLKLELHEDEVTTIPGPVPLFIHAPRLGYLPQVADRALDHFRSVLPPGNDQPWFEYKGVPLKWHIPTGVLYDLLSSGECPWELTIHFRLYPENVVLPFSGDETLQSSYFNSIKEAAFVLGGSSSAVMSMSQKGQDAMWVNVKECDHRSFWENVEKLEITQASKNRLPLRLYLRRNVFDTILGWKSVEYVSKSFQLNQQLEGEDRGECLTIGDVLQQAIPTLTEEQTRRAKVTMAGVEVDLKASVESMYKHLRNPDLWLYICILMVA